MSSQDYTTILLNIISLKNTARFRGIRLVKNNRGGLLIKLSTRNGGQNRDCMEREYSNNENVNSEKCGCTACIQTYVIPKNPNYLYDEDDDYDNTYADTYFSIPEKQRKM